jgi:hypothetical protein
MRKFKASVEPSWYVKIGKYVDYLHDACTQRIPYKAACYLASLISMAGRTSRVLLVYIITWS